MSLPAIGPRGTRQQTGKGEMVLKSKLIILVLAMVCWTCAAAKDGTAGNTNSAAESTAPAVQTGRGTAVIDLGGRVSIDYGRPSLSGRSETELLSRIQPGGEWRMGADADTRLTTDVPLKFGDKVVQKGAYVLRAKLVEPEKWALKLLDTSEAVVAEVPLKFKKVENAVEQMTITLEKSGNDGKFMLQWGKMSLSTEFKKA